MTYEYEITPKHAELIDKILAERNAGYSAYVWNVETNADLEKSRLFICDGCGRQESYANSVQAVANGWEVFKGAEFCWGCN